jgi:hypothetical protein
MYACKPRRQSESTALIRVKWRFDCGLSGLRSLFFEMSLHNSYRQSNSPQRFEPDNAIVK